MQNRNIIPVILLALATLIACGGKKTPKAEEGKLTKDLQLSDDKTIYGLACDGCTDSVMYLLPNDGSDPIKYDIIDATRLHKVIGKPKIGDWIGIVRNPTDTTVADFVINLDQLKGTWCYIVMPQMKDFENLSKRTQARIMRDMPDSIKQTYLIPREYGFTLKRQFQASSVGFVPSASSLEEESPVVYPKMAYYFAWHILNGKLILSRYTSDPPMNISGNAKDQEQKMPDVIMDTIDVVYLSDDSLVLSSDGVSRSYYRISKATEANKLAREKAQALAKQALKDVTHSGSANENKDGNDKVAAAAEDLKK